VEELVRSLRTPYGRFQQLAHSHHEISGQYAEDPLSIFSNFHRYYEPATGRYLSTDPIGQLGASICMRTCSTTPCSRTIFSDSD